jgi:hypothetical protein
VHWQSGLAEAAETQVASQVVLQHCGLAAQTAVAQALQPFASAAPCWLSGWLQLFGVGVLQVQEASPSAAVTHWSSQ